jgi:hypothetical protein
MNKTTLKEMTTNGKKERLGDLVQYISKRCESSAIEGENNCTITFDRLGDLVNYCGGFYRRRMDKFEFKDAEDIILNIVSDLRYVMEQDIKIGRFDGKINLFLHW